jgi:fructose 1,6-bisphosphate aldolase/phosphatase
MKITFSILKADVGSIGSHTKPSDRMMDAVGRAADEAIKSGLLIDAFVGHTADNESVFPSVEIAKAP